MKYLFYIAKLYSIPIIQPLMDYLDEREEHQYAALVSKKAARLLREKKLWQDKKIITTVKEGQNFKPDFCLTPGNYIDFRLPGLKVEIFHGIGIEKESHYVIRHFFDIYLTSGPVVTERFSRLQKKYGYFLVRETGWPKIDYILNYPADSIREDYGYGGERKIILYAPTFSDKLQSGSDLLPVLQKVIKDSEICLIKFHELMNKEFIKAIENSQSDKLKLVDTYDITPYLHIADLMISDTSSVIYEFMALDKPVITYNTKKRKDKGINITSPEQLRPAIDRALSHPEEHAGNRKKHLEEVNPYLDGKTSEKVFQILHEIYQENVLPAKKKPLNLFRKFTIIKNELFRKGYLK